MATITDAKGNVIRTEPDMLEDWRQAAQVEAGLRREFQDEVERLRKILSAVQDALKARGLFAFEHIDGTYTINDR